MSREEIGSSLQTDLDHRTLLLMRNGVGVRQSTPRRLTYDLTVVADDVGELVRAAGGWLCDRVRCGWQVTVVLSSDDPDVRPLRILGIDRFIIGDPYEAIKGSSPASFAAAAGVLTADARIGQYVERASERKVTEILLWGALPPAEVTERFDRVAHVPSAAARAFKPHALAAAGFATDDPNRIEKFHGAAAWYPLDGTDLVPAS